MTVFTVSGHKLYSYYIARSFSTLYVSRATLQTKAYKAALTVVNLGTTSGETVELKCM